MGCSFEGHFVKGNKSAVMADFNRRMLRAMLTVLKQHHVNQSKKRVQVYSNPYPNPTVYRKPPIQTRLQIRDSLRKQTMRTSTTKGVSQCINTNNERQHAHEITLENFTYSESMACWYDQPPRFSQKMFKTKEAAEKFLILKTKKWQGPLAVRCIDGWYYGGMRPY
jgi:hypothetical protein